MKRSSVSWAALLFLSPLVGCCGPIGSTPYGTGTSSGPGAPVAMTQGTAFYRGSSPFSPNQSIALMPPMPLATGPFVQSIPYGSSQGVYTASAFGAAGNAYSVSARRRRHSRHMNVAVKSGSQADYVRRSGTPAAIRLASSKELAGGLGPTPDQDLKYRGGKVIQHLDYVNIYVGGNSSWDPNDIQMIDSKLEAAMTDPNLNNVVMQYYGNQPVTSRSHPSHVLQGARPNVVTKGDTENIVAFLYKQGNLSSFDLNNTVFNLMLPRGTVLTDDDAPGGAQSTAAQAPSTPTPPINRKKDIPIEDEVSSQGGLGGYHGSIHVGSATIYYAVGVYSERRPDGTPNGIPVFDQSWKNVVATFYHELNEARTNPDVEDAIRAGDDPSADRFLGWTSDAGEEVGDYPVDEAKALTQVFQEVKLADGSGTVPVQLLYSNAVHGPEGPIPAPHGAVPPPRDPPPAAPSNGNAGASHGGTGDAGLDALEANWSRLSPKEKNDLLDIFNDILNKAGP